MNQIDFEEFKQRIDEFKDKCAYVSIDSSLKTLFIIENSKILINNYRIIFTDGKDVDVEFNIDQFSNFYISKFENDFKLQSEELGDILINFDKNS